MTEWKLKRFWTEACVSEAEGGYAVLLDGRGVKTPAKASLVVPTGELANMVKPICCVTAQIALLS